MSNCVVFYEYTVRGFVEIEKKISDNEALALANTTVDDIRAKYRENPNCAVIEVETAVAEGGLAKYIRDAVLDDRNKASYTTATVRKMPAS